MLLVHDKLDNLSKHPQYCQLIWNLRNLSGCSQKNITHRVILSAHFQIAGFYDIISSKVNSGIINKLYFVALICIT